MNVIDLLVRDHETVASLLQAFFEADRADDETRRDIVGVDAKVKVLKEEVMAEASAFSSPVFSDDTIAAEGPRRTSAPGGLRDRRPPRPPRVGSR